MEATHCHIQENISKVVATAVLSMSAEVKASRARLEELLTRKEQADAENELSEADLNRGNYQTREREPMQVQSTQQPRQVDTHHYQDSGHISLPTMQSEDREDPPVRHHQIVLRTETFTDIFHSGMAFLSTFKFSDRFSGARAGARYGHHCKT